VTEQTIGVGTQTNKVNRLVDLSFETPSERPVTDEKELCAGHLGSHQRPSSDQNVLTLLATQTAKTGNHRAAPK
jgi:hypothetical protein